MVAKKTVSFHGGLPMPVEQRYYKDKWIYELRKVEMARGTWNYIIINGNLHCL